MSYARTELGELLAKFGYDPADGEQLYHEGMGLHELDGRLRMGESGVGSLAHSHNIKLLVGRQVRTPSGAPGVVTETDFNEHGEPTTYRIKLNDGRYGWFTHYKPFGWIKQKKHRWG